MVDDFPGDVPGRSKLTGNAYSTLATLVSSAALGGPEASLQNCAAFYRGLDSVAGTYTAAVRIESMKLNSFLKMKVQSR